MKVTWTVNDKIKRTDKKRLFNRPYNQDTK